MRTWLVTVVVALIACAGDTDSRAPTLDADLTKRQRDSILAQSRIPGASGVGAAMRVADSVEARLRRADSIGP